MGVWQKVFAACDEFLEDCGKFAPDTCEPGFADGLYLPKTLDRLEIVEKECGISATRDWRINGRCTPSLTRMAETAAAIVYAEEARPAVMHGDFCFSNIFYDFRSESIKAIDPRGSIDGDAPTIYGDLRYDVAKLHHSVIGYYDHIISGFYSVTRDGNDSMTFELMEDRATAAIQACFLERTFAGYATDARSTQAISVLLFLSMIPLHQDDRRRQLAFMANASRLFHGLKA